MFYDSPSSFWDAGGLYDEVSSPQRRSKHMSKSKLGLRDLDLQGTLDFATTIKTAMTGNATFATPNPSLASIGTLITTAQTKLNTWNSGVAAVATAKSDRDAAFEALRDGLTQLALYVDNIANGDRVKIESAGMPVRNEPEPVGTPAQVDDLVVMASEFDGALDASWSPVRGAVFYEIEASVDPVTLTSWAHKENSATASLRVISFTSGTKMWLRVRAVGADNVKGPWSDPAAKTVP